MGKGDMRVPNRFGGMRDLPFFSRDMQDLIWKQGREAGITVTSGSRISRFYGVGMQELQEEQSGIWDFKFLCDHINTESWQKRTYCACSCVRFQVMNSNSPVNIHYSQTTLVSWVSEVLWVLSFVLVTAQGVHTICLGSRLLFDIYRLPHLKPYIANCVCESMINMELPYLWCIVVLLPQKRFLERFWMNLSSPLTVLYNFLPCLPIIKNSQRRTQIHSKSLKKPLLRQKDD